MIYNFINNEIEILGLYILKLLLLLLIIIIIKITN